MQLFVPSARVYGLLDKVPFHIQLNGPLGALRQLLVPHSVNSSTPFHFNQESSESCPPHTKPTIKVSLLRQSRVETRGYKSWMNKTIGQGKVWELPPLICNSRGTVHLDWAGEVQADKDVDVGGFITGNISVRVCRSTQVIQKCSNFPVLFQDFITLVLEPSTIDKQASPYLSLQMSIPIRFVSDSYVEVTGEPPPV
ncbi:hypothetical protein C0992_010894 [Termitomyces sp. T32_za158]|nr:hypothetical protein C0992_010894 [Termitomyces sp. T32_za158]